VLLGALIGTRAALVADRANIASHSAQTAFVTAASLMARSGHNQAARIARIQAASTGGIDRKTLSSQQLTGSGFTEFCKPFPSARHAFKASAI
jgi:hypothetical protein